jgi:outer membrane protein assembly factor BamB
MNNYVTGFAFTLAVLLTPFCASGGDWPQWRGPAFNGSSPEKPLRSNWDKTNGVKWSASLPGYAASTPVVFGKSVFLTSPADDKDLLLLKFNADTGREEWRKTVAASADRDKGRNNMSSPSPVTDGKVVVAMFADGSLASYDFSGKQLWIRNLAQEHGAFSYMWIYGASPLLHAGRLYVPVLQRGPVPADYGHARDGSTERDSFLLCLDPATGTNIWRHLRVTAAQGESMESYTTPIPRQTANGAEILLFGAHHVTAHDPETGVERWRSPDLNPEKFGWWRVVPSPVVVQDLVVVSAPRREPVFAIRPTGAGQLGPESIAWSYKDQPSDCCSPLVYNDQLYVLNGDRQVMTRLDPQSGRAIWQGNLGVRETFRASPLGADGRIYCISEPGTVVVLAAGDEFKVLSTISMGEAPVRSSMIASAGRIYIRTAKHLYCVAEK